MSDDASLIAELVKVLETIANINAAHLRENAEYDDRVAEWMPSAFAVVAQAKYRLKS